MLDPIIIAAIVTLIGNIILNIFQFRNFLSQAKEKESQAASNLIERALDVSKEEVASLRAMNADLIKRLEERGQEIAELKSRICFLENRVKELEAKLENKNNY